MKNLKSVVVIILSITLFSCSCKQKQETNITQEVTQEQQIIPISVTKLAKIDHSVQLLDVRTPEEYKQGYIKNATNINFFDNDFVAHVSNKLDKNKPVYLYCKSGGRSGRASKKLKEAGFTKIYDLEGGFDQWKSSLKSITHIK